MAPAPVADRRQHARYPLATSVQFHHSPSRRDIPGRCADISRSGMKMYVPAATPVRPGDPIQVTLGSTGRPEFSALADGPVPASIVRVDRNALLASGHLAVGVRFMAS